MEEFRNKWEGEGILIADDDVYSHILLEKVIKKTGANIYHAYNGLEALDILTVQHKNIRVAILDIIMPCMTGYEVLEKFGVENSQVCFIAYTADVLRLNIDRCSKAGFLRYFSKPMLPYKLMLEIDKLMFVMNKL